MVALSSEIPIIPRIISVLIGYAFGLILLGYILGRLSNIDIRTRGSGNVGTTNATRVLGKKKGVLTLVCDIGKGLLAAGVCYLIFRGAYPEDAYVFAVYGAFGAVLGHDFPFYMGFKGGKGVATSLAFLAVVNVKIMPFAAAVFILVALITKYVSLASMAGDLVSVLLLYGFGGLDDYMYNFEAYKQVCILVAIVASLLIIRHKANIERLLLGEENKLTLFSKNKKEPSTVPRTK